MKKVISFFLVILSIFCLTACGYNRLMRNHLSDKDNYVTVSAEFMSYEDNDDFMVIKIKNSDSIKDSEAFDASENDHDEIRLEIVGENYNILRDQFINGEIKPGTMISLRCSTWIYMDGNFYYIAELKTQDKTYLEFDDGIANIKDYMNHNKSLL